MKITERMKSEIAEIKDCSYDEVQCCNCSNWGYNRGNVIDNCGGSRCKVRKINVYSYNFCKRFEKLDKVAII